MDLESRIDFANCNTPDSILVRYNEIRKYLMENAPKEELNRLTISLNKARGRRMAAVTEEISMAARGVTRLYEEVPFTLVPAATLASILPIQDDGLRNIMRVDSNGVMHI